MLTFFWSLWGLTEIACTSTKQSFWHQCKLKQHWFIFPLPAPCSYQALHLSLQLWFWLLLSFLFLPDVGSTSSGYNHPSPLLWTTSLCSQPTLTPTLPQKVNLHHNPFLNQLNLSSVGVHANNLGIMRKHAVADLAGLGQVLRFCISNMFPGNASDSGAWTHQIARDQTRTPFQVATAPAGQESLALF